jgi:hypothetical protein
MRARIVTLIVGLSAAQAAWSSPELTLTEPSCLANEKNAAVVASLPDGATEARLYFRREVHGDFYWTAFQPGPGGQSFALFPKPDNENRSVEYYVDVKGATATPPDHKKLPVTDDCKVDLTDEQGDAAKKLAVGETTADQRGRAVAWFLCMGIVERVDVTGKRRPDEFCGLSPTPGMSESVPEETGATVTPTGQPPVSPTGPGGGR